MEGLNLFTLQLKLLLTDLLETNVDNNPITIGKKEFSLYNKKGQHKVAFGKRKEELNYK